MWISVSHFYILPLVLFNFLCFHLFVICSCVSSAELRQQSHTYEVENLKLQSVISDLSWSICGSRKGCRDETWLMSCSFTHPATLSMILMVKSSSILTLLLLCFGLNQLLGEIFLFSAPKYSQAGNWLCPDVDTYHRCVNYHHHHQFFKPHFAVQFTQLPVNVRHLILIRQQSTFLSGRNNYTQSSAPSWTQWSIKLLRAT